MQDSTVTTLAEVETLTDADIRALEAYLDEAAASPEPVEASAAPSVAIVACGVEKTAKGKKSTRKHTEKRRLQLVESARRHRDRKKNEFAELQEEAVLLEKQLEMLRRQHKTRAKSSAIAQWEERAAFELIKRRKAEATHEQLRFATYNYGCYIRGMRSVFSSSPMVNSELNMQHLLHSISCLGRSATARARECRSACTNEKLDRAIEIVTRETAGIQLCDLDGRHVRSPSITTRRIRAREDQFGMTCVAVYALETVDTDRIFQAASGAILGFGAEWPGHTLKKSNVHIVDSPAETIRYGIFATRYVNDATSDEVELGGSMLSYYRVTNSYIILLWDYVDKDDLHPLPPNASIRRDVTGALLVRQEVCEDGVERVVCRSACTKMHTFRTPAAAREKSGRMFGELMEAGAKVCGFEVYNVIKEEAFVLGEKLRSSTSQVYV